MSLIWTDTHHRFAEVISLSRQTEAETGRTKQVLGRPTFAKARTIAAIRKAERRRLARDLHDLAGPELTALNMGLGTLAMQLEAFTPRAATPAVTATVEDLQISLSRLSRTIREIVSDRRAGTDATETPETALKQLVSIWTARNPKRAVQMEVDPRAWVILGPGTAHQLLAIITEALTNIARHAEGARSVSLMLKPRGCGGEVVCILTDDGCGFAQETVGEDGNGLGGMRERAKLLGARLRIVSAEGRGTSIILEIPTQGGLS